MPEFITMPTKRLYEYWLTLPKAGILPLRSSVNPADIKDILPEVSIAEWIAPDTLKFRLAGTGVVERLGFDPTGRNFLDLIGSEEKNRMVRRLALIMDTPCGARSVRQEDYQGGLQRLVEHVALPLDSGRTGLSMLIAATGQLDRSEAVAKSSRLTRIGMPLDYEFIDLGAGVPELNLDDD
jgi:hypothetical protein